MVKGVSIEGNRVEIELATQQAIGKRSYDAAVNALWEGRLALDQTVGLFDEPPWSYRLKHAIFLTCKAKANPPCVTIVQGAYGDLVNFGGGNFYLSWYPSCMQGFSKNGIHAPAWNKDLPEKQSRLLATEALQRLSEYIPSLHSVRLDECWNLSVLGGVIYARGMTDVSDPKSGLHNRYEPSIKSKGTYYSINPGKYSLCPSFAYEAANQICPAAAQLL